MEALARPSQFPDNFAHLSASLHRRVSQFGKNLSKCTIRVWIDYEPFGYFWPSPVGVEANGDFIMLPAFMASLQVMITFVDKDSLPLATAVHAKPLGLNDAFFADELSEELAQLDLLDQIRLAADGMKFALKVSGKAINFLVTSIEPKSELAVLVKDTELILDLGEKSKAIAKIPALPAKDAVLSVVADPRVKPGFAQYNLADLLDLGWSIVEKRVLLVVEPMGRAGRYVQPLGLIGESGPSKLILKGTLHVHPSFILGNNLINTCFAKVRNESIGTVRSENAPLIKVKTNSSAPFEELLSVFFFPEAGLYICPNGLRADDIELPFQSGKPFVSFDKTASAEYDFGLDCQSRPQYDFTQRNLEVTPLIKNISSGVILVRGDPGSGKSTYMRHLEASMRCCLFDFELYENFVLEACKHLKDIASNLETVEPHSPFIFDHVDWILEPLNMEQLPEEDRWAFDSLKKRFEQFILSLERPIFLVVSPRIVLGKCSVKLQSAVLWSFTIESSFTEQLTQNYATEGLLTWEDIFGQEEAKVILEESIIWPIKWTALYAANNLPRTAGILLHGPTGSGKTALMNALSSRLPGLHIIRVRGPELLNKYIGASEEAIRRVFEEARKHRPALVCFDEVDALASRRGHDNTGVTDRVVNQLLTEIDGTSEREGIFIVATSSRIDLIDPALLRSGRIDQHIELHLPDTAERKVIIEAYLNEASDDQVTKINQMTDGLSIAHIKGILYDAQVASVKSEEREDLASLVIDRLKALKISSQRKPPNKKKSRATFA